MPKVFELTLNNGYDKSGRQTVRAADLEQCGRILPHMRSCSRHIRNRLQYFLDIKIKGSNVIERIYAEHMPVPFLSVITNDCIRKGKDYNGGGARYNTKYLQGVGIGTITDCLAAVKYHVYDKKTFTMEELMQSAGR